MCAKCTGRAHPRKTPSSLGFPKRRDSCLERTVFNQTHCRSVGLRFRATFRLVVCCTVGLKWENRIPRGHRLRPLGAAAALWPVFGPSHLPAGRPGRPKVSESRETFGRWFRPACRHTGALRSPAPSAEGGRWREWQRQPTGIANLRSIQSCPAAQTTYRQAFSELLFSPSRAAGARLTAADRPLRVRRRWPRKS